MKKMNNHHRGILNHFFEPLQLNHRPELIIADGILKIGEQFEIRFAKGQYRVFETKPGSQFLLFSDENFLEACESAAALWYGNVLAAEVREKIESQLVITK